MQSKGFMSHFHYDTAKALVVLHAVIWHSHISPLLIHWWCISSLIKAECCDACNINHIQCMGRVSSSVHQLESALASGVGCVILRSIIPYKSDSLFAGAVLVSGRAGRAIYFPFAHSLKLGLKTFSTTFPWTELAMILGGRRSIEMRVDSFWILFRNNV